MPDHDVQHICPNCGEPTTGNFCAECGQSTHLHKETFVSLIVHFVSHYFHYDSKFGKTIKALWFSPGKLTTAYWNKQRARYIPPISLYIFISTVFFLIGFSSGHKKANKDGDGHLKTQKNSNILIAKPDKNGLNIVNDSAGTQASLDSLIAADSSGIIKRLLDRTNEIEQEHGGFGEFVSEKMKHALPKMLFFMIPIMALLLKVVYGKRKDIYFVDHAIFALHYQALAFSLLALTLIETNQLFDGILFIATISATFLYMVLAIRNVYGSSIGKAIINSLTVAFGYFFILLIIFIVYFITMVYFA